MWAGWPASSQLTQVTFPPTLIRISAGTDSDEIETYHDHRFAMSFGILGCHDLRKNGQPWLTIKDPGCCAKTFPSFFDLLAALHAGSH